MTVPIPLQDGNALPTPPTPSEYLAKCLQSAGYPLGTNLQPSKGTPTTKFKFDRVVSRYVLWKMERKQAHVRQSLQTILGAYIRLKDSSLLRQSENERESLDTGLLDVFDASNYKYLTARGYDVEDIVAWAWILTSKNPSQAAYRMFTFEADCTNRYGTDKPRIPPFITLMLLKEEFLDSNTFRLLLIHSLHLMTGQPLTCIEHLANVSTGIKVPTGDISPQVDRDTCMTMVARLIRQARVVWPEAFPIIARAFSAFSTTIGTSDEPQSVLQKLKGDRWKAKMYNTCLWLLSLPTNTQPYRNVFIQQQAQFELLKAMAMHEPVLHITRQGYRAVAALQVAHKKTAAERQSADLKAPSWPPWKEEKMGIDAHRGNEGMYSRAMSVFSQMKEAGYSHQLWEEMCAILAGWDTDGSPTIQTRSLVPRPQALSFSLDRRPDHYSVWVARIRATRTVREAWACFLSYRDQGLAPKAAISVAMAEKLIYRGKAKKTAFEESSSALPGDGPEVYSEPSSARDLIYVQTEPPTLAEFLEEMVSQKVRFSGRFLALLLDTAPSLAAGLFDLRNSNLTPHQIMALCTISNRPSDYPKLHLKALERLRDFTFASFIKFLCTISDLSAGSLMNIISRSNDLQNLDPSTGTALGTDLFDLGRNTHHPLALWHAIQLVKGRQPPCRAAWSHLLFALGNASLKIQFTRTHARSHHRLIVWHATLVVLSWMRERGVELGPHGFSVLCLAFSKAVDAGMSHPESVGVALEWYQGLSISSVPMEIDGSDSFDSMVENGLSILKSEFDRIILPAAKISNVAKRGVPISETSLNIQLPAMLHVPSFSTLHNFVRALGRAGDGDGLLNLLQRMSQSAATLNEIAEERLNGDIMMRRTLTALRVYLEEMEESVEGRSNSKIQEAEDIVSRTNGWEWPSDEEVEEYRL
ncbi:hypothetical protein N7495_008079 [Penicillium taxi]|uniref:uncharacterized protein n=1 Tax=Penicillium taxi TaxID=168475 RepID=UPI0025455E6E|nr:uncharacterized protein N7495_008079 [Penicillium taxi]KAJ5888038.1 hypothetical protein N7495_008079 [Penicillium taxi]